MSGRSWRLPVLGALAAAVLGAGVLLAAWFIATHAVRVAVAGQDPLSGGPTGRAYITELTRQLFGWSLLLLPVLAALGAVLGRRMALELRALRNALLARTRSEEEVPLPQSLIAEVDELALAGERAWQEAGRRAAGVEQQRSMLAVLVESVNEGLLRVDGAGRIVFANPECRALLELLPSALGQAYAAVVRSTAMRNIIARALAGERVGGTEVTLGERRVLVSAQPIAAERGAGGPGTSPGAGESQGMPAITGRAGAVLALADLTELRRLEGVRRDFVANVSHELKTPLTSLRGYAETLLHDDVEPAMARQFLEVIRRNAERLQQIVDDLLDLSRIESGSWQPDLQRVDAAEVIRDVWASCRDRAERKRIHFSAPGQPCQVLADPGALRQVLANLFDNALRYTPEGGSIEVRIGAPVLRPPRPGARSASETSRWRQFEVRDSGTGIPRDALTRIFERFYRVDPARSRAEGGTGLGLSIVKHLVESMGGVVSADSELGRGTAIRFTLPTDA